MSSLPMDANAIDLLRNTLRERLREFSWREKATMAATVSSVWAKPGAWALDSEENEAELLQQQKEEKTYAKSSGGGHTAEFPSLMAAASTKTKKKKSQSMSLAEFNNPAPHKTTQTLGRTTEDLMMLPTGPRERTADDLDRSRLGGGFRSYDWNRDDSSNSKWGSSRGSDEPRRQDRELAPSRADEVGDWGASKKSMSGNGFERKDRGERGGFFGAESRADESDNWGSKKSFVPSDGRRMERDRRVVGFESSGGADSDNWLRKKEEEGKKFGGSFDSLRERRGGLDSSTNGGDSENWGKRREEGIGSGVRPRLNLQPRTLPVVDVQQNGGGGAPPKPKVSNPFGEARPREEVLKEKGQDWKEIEEKLESTKIKEIDGPAFGKSFGSGNGRATMADERSWRKADSADDRPSSADKVEDDLDHVEGDLAEEPEDTHG